MGSQQKQPQEPLQSTFWTMCPSCKVKYEYHRDLIDKILWCQYCNKPYTALEIKNHAPENHTPWTICPYCSVKFQYCKTVSGDDEDPNLAKEAPTTSKLENSSKPIEDYDFNNVKPKETENAATYIETQEYFLPDFNDFDKDRREECFRVGQIWAVYDSLDGMPRFYAGINKRISESNFKLSITWLEPDIDDSSIDAGLPFSCGNFRIGATQIVDDRLIFSHRVSCEKGSKRNTYKIYPRKGETWAVFKKWDMNSHSYPRKYEYTFVLIMSDYHKDNGITVAYLGKVKGFSCLFCRTTKGGVNLFQIPPSQLYRFSHRVPFFRLSGNERDGVPKNSFELDPASLPSKLEEIDIPKEMELDFSEEITRSYEVPEPVFYNFDIEKSVEKFQPGQYWALYSVEDGFPKYYAFVEKIDYQPKFEVHVSWLREYRVKKTAKYKKTVRDMPVGCGIFKHYKDDTSSYTDSRVFSHRLTVEPTDKENVYAINPKKGEVWAMYRNWNPRMSCLDLENCEYDIVEVLEENDLAIKALVLEMVTGYNSVFKGQTNNGSLVIIQILRSVFCKFSHQVPAFRLTNERRGRKRWYWELDAAALPKTMLGLTGRK